MRVGQVCPEASHLPTPEGPTTRRGWAQASGASDPSVIWGLAPLWTSVSPSVKSQAVASVGRPKEPRASTEGRQSTEEGLRLWGEALPPMLSSLASGPLSHQREMAGASHLAS